VAVAFPQHPREGRRFLSVLPVISFIQQAKSQSRVDVQHTKYPTMDERMGTADSFTFDDRAGTNHTHIPPFST
jgi:hypothetical protein